MVNAVRRVNHVGSAHVSVFSNPPNRTPESSAAYVRAVLELLGDREPVAVMEELLAELQRLTAGLPDALLRRPEAEGKWSIVQIVQHLADVELVNGYRLRLILAEERPTIVGFNQESWARALRYDGVALADALDQLRALRAANLRLARSLSAEQLERVGLRAERGPESVRRMLALMAGHDLVHRRQIERVRQGLGG
jgi:hypothetical protein